MNAATSLIPENQFAVHASQFSGGREFRDWALRGLVVPRRLWPRQILGGLRDGLPRRLRFPTTGLELRRDKRSGRRATIGREPLRCVVAPARTSATTVCVREPA